VREPPDATIEETAASSVVTRCFPTVPAPVKVEVATFQTAAGMSAKFAARDEDAASTVAFVFPFTTAAIEEDAVSVCAFTALVTPAVAVFVFPFTTAATEELALCTSDKVAKEPDESPASVSVLVPVPHTSDASVPNEVSVLVPAAHTLVGIPVTEEAMVVSIVPIEEDAMSV
jgi:hypothetical protein